MNVSSVKNLNGEVFSAVQDASLTNVVQTNSGNWQDITAYQNASATYLTAVDLSPYATTAEVDTLSSMLSGAIDYVSANAGDEFPVSADEAIQYVQTNSAQIDETVTSFQTNSSTYMTEPNLEYNAVNEISGYNGSAIAQYGAEKQWLVHDDTIVHISNSAQYAFGCNISALQRLMGIDETVLYSNTAVSNTIVLNEDCTNFNRLRLKIYSPQSTGFVSYHEIEPKTNELWFARQCMIPAAQYKLQIVCEYFTANNAKNYKFVSGCRWYGNNNVAGGNTTTNLTGDSLKDGGYITEIVGIGRKQ